MNTKPADWRADLDASRDLNDREKQQFGFLVSWYESWRERQKLEPGRAAGVAFWKAQVEVKPRKDWQLERWAEAMRWYLRWLQCCQSEGREVRSVGERMGEAVMRAGARRGLALRTRETYASWTRRFGEWVGDARSAMDTGRGSEWLEHLMADSKVSFATQKQALNALVCFYRDECGIEDVRLDAEAGFVEDVGELPWRGWVVGTLIGWQVTGLIGKPLPIVGRGPRQGENVMGQDENELAELWRKSVRQDAGAPHGIASRKGGWSGLGRRRRRWWSRRSDCHGP